MKTAAQKLTTGLIICLTIGALTTIITLLLTTNSYQSEISKLLFTGVSLVFFSLFALGCSTIQNQKHIYTFIFWGGMISAALGFLSSLGNIWLDPMLTSSDMMTPVVQILASCIVISFSCAYLSMVALSSPRTTTGKELFDITSVLAALTAGAAIIDIIAIDDAVPI
ncbi:hypothetical protein KBB08_00390, partial [Candidatus Gracilibacteria bacterium]|nr:hypothetical protein [Candidatus Gracilibacteria bacterium]